MAPGEVAIKLAEMGFSNRGEGEWLSTEEAFRALLRASNTSEELAERAGVSMGQLPEDAQEDIIADVARVAAVEKGDIRSGCQRDHLRGSGQ